MNVVFDNVVKNFGKVTALAGVSVDIASGELFFLLGPSGCGKTTMLRMIAGFEIADSGRLLFDGRDVRDVPPHLRHTGMVFQGYALWPHMTVAQNVAFGLEMKNLPRPDRERRVFETLRKVRIEELAQRKPAELSGGQQQRVALARTLVVEPSCLLLDEPLANLDAKLRRDMRSEIRRICKQTGLTAIYVTHDRAEALSMGDRMAVLDKGSILQVGSPREVYARPVNAFVAGFIGETNFVRGKLLDAGADAATVETPLGRLASTVPPLDGGSAGADVTVSLRPETLRIVSHADPVATNRFRARLVESTYLGEMAEHVVTVGDCTQLRLFELNPRAAARTGEEVSVAVAPEDVVVLPDAPPA
jgi:iron(III) transport system ATP-binding protein